jgi:hypothetical protein
LVPATIPFQAACGSEATIPPKMMIETPLPIPFWVINSPSQISSMVPAVMEIRIARVPRISWSKPKAGRMGCWLVALRNCTVPKAWRKASGTVR